MQTVAAHPAAPPGASPGGPGAGAGAGPGASPGGPGPGPGAGPGPCAWAAAASVAARAAAVAVLAGPPGGGRALWGPAVGAVHAEHGAEPPDRNGNLTLITHPVTGNVFYNKGVGVDRFVLARGAGPAAAGVREVLRLVVLDRSGARPAGWGRAAEAAEGIAAGDVLLQADVGAAVALAPARGRHWPAEGLSWWRGAGCFHFLLGEARRGAAGKVPKGQFRTASFVLEYAQLARGGAAGGGGGGGADGWAEVYRERVAAPFVVRAGNAAVAARGRASKAAVNAKKRAVHALLEARDAGGAAGLGPRSPLREYERRAAEAGVAAAAVEAACGKRARREAAGAGAGGGPAALGAL
jgi:hypothetical protein